MKISDIPPILSYNGDSTTKTCTCLSNSHSTQKKSASESTDLKIVGEWIESGFWEKAWSGLQQLSILQRLSPDALRMRLECSIRLEKWDSAKALAELLDTKSHLDRIAKFDYHRASISLLLSKRDLMGAWEAARLALEIWPEGEMKLRKDPSFKSLQKTARNHPILTGSPLIG